jgi:hypothetical protein
VKHLGLQAGDHVREMRYVQNAIEERTRVSVVPLRRSIDSPTRDVGARCMRAQGVGAAATSTMNGLPHEPPLNEL